VTPRTHCLTFCGALALIALLRGAFAEYYTNDLRSAARLATERQSNEIESDWRNRVYVNIELAGTKQAMLERLRSSYYGLSDAQKHRLDARLLQVLYYLERPTFEDYFRLRTEGFQYHFVLSERARQMLEPNETSKQGDAQDRQLTQTIWNNSVARDAAFPHISAVCVESTAGAVTTNNSGRLLLKGPVRKGMTVAFEAINPGFVYDSSAGPYFEFSFLARVGLHNVGPVHISVQWLAQNDDWAVNRLIADTWLKFKPLF
jgi:hypothetical protein